MSHLASPPRGRVSQVGPLWARGEGGGAHGRRGKRSRQGAQGGGRRAGARSGDTDIRAAGRPGTRAAGRSGTAAKEQAIARSAPEKTGNMPLAVRHTRRRQASSQESSQTGAALGEPGSSGPVVLFPKRRGRAGQRCLWSSVGGEPLRGPQHASAWGPHRTPNGPLDPPNPRLRAAVVPAAAAASEPRRPRCHGSGPALAGQPMGGGGSGKEEEWFLLVWNSRGMALGTVPHARRPRNPVPARHPPGLIRRSTSASSAGGRRGAWRHPDSSSVPGQRQAPNGQSPLLGPEGARCSQTSGGCPRRWRRATGPRVAGLARTPSGRAGQSHGSPPHPGGRGGEEERKRERGHRGRE